MLLPEQHRSFISSLRQSLSDNTFVKLSLGNYKGDEVDLKNVYIKKVVIKKNDQFSFTYRYKTRDIVKNYEEKECLEKLQQALMDGFNIATLFTVEFDLQLELLANKKLVLRKNKASHSTAPDKEHDRNKKRHIVAGTSSYLHDLNITSADGKILSHAQDKFRQINHYIELLSTLLRELPFYEELKVADMGSGKGYLTFALYDYLQNTLHVKADVTGIEYRDDLVTLCNEVAMKNQFANLHFIKGSIEEYDCSDVNVLIALHACDTATDDAICKGINANAHLIVVAPCCHKQIRNEIEHGKKQNDLDFILRHGIYLERQAEMVTDSIRALILEYYGYKTKVIEFISEAHTPKNVMIVAEKKQSLDHLDQDSLLQKIKEAKAFFGIRKHHLEMRMGL